MNLFSTFKRLVKLLNNKIKRFDEFVKSGDNRRDCGDWLNAIMFYTKALSLYNNKAFVWVQLGHAYKESGSLDKAEDAYLKAYKLEPQNSDTLLQMGHLNKLKGDLTLSLECYKKAFNLDKSNEDAIHELILLDAFSDDEIFNEHMAFNLHNVCWVTNISLDLAQSKSIEVDWFMNLSKVALENWNCRNVCVEVRNSEFYISSLGKYKNEIEESYQYNDINGKDNLFIFLITQNSNSAEQLRKISFVRNLSNAKFVALIRNFNPYTTQDDELLLLVADQSLFIVVYYQMAEKVQNLVLNCGRDPNIVCVIYPEDKANHKLDFLGKVSSFNLIIAPSLDGVKLIQELLKFRNKLSRVSLVIKNGQDGIQNIPINLLEELQVDEVNEYEALNLIKTNKNAVLFIGQNSVETELWAELTFKYNRPIVAHISSIMKLGFLGDYPKYFTDLSESLFDFNNVTVSSDQYHEILRKLQETWLDTIAIGIKKLPHSIPKPLRLIEYGCFYCFCQPTLINRLTFLSGAKFLSGASWGSPSESGVCLSSDTGKIEFLVKGIVKSKMIVKILLSQVENGIASLKWLEVTATKVDNGNLTPMTKFVTSVHKNAIVKDDSNCLIKGMVVYPKHLDYFWYAFLDRDSSAIVRAID